VADDLVDTVINRDGAGVSFYGQMAAHVALRDAVAIAIELQTKILVDEQFDAVAVIIRNDRQRLKWAESDRWGAGGFRDAAAGWRLL
jgi:hypothetical protein